MRVTFLHLVGCTYCRRIEKRFVTLGPKAVQSGHQWQVIRSDSPEELRTIALNYGLKVPSFPSFIVQGPTEFALVVGSGSGPILEVLAHTAAPL